jgi:hypothetical protein
MKKRGRPEFFNDSKRKEFLALIGGTHSRHAAAAAVGIAPSTVSKRLKWDVDFAEAVRAAEQIPETDLLAIMRKHCEKSWLATRWLLELKHPERYCKRKGSAVFGPSADDVYDAVIGVLSEEITDEALRERIEARLDRLAEHEFFNTHAAASEVASEQKVSEDPATNKLESNELDSEERAQDEQAPDDIVADESESKESESNAEESNEDESADQEPAEQAPSIADVAELPQGDVIAPLVEQSAQPCSALEVALAAPLEDSPRIELVESPPARSPTPARPTAQRLAMRRQAEEKKRLRKLSDHQRKKQLKQRAQARRLKKSKR